MAIIGNSRLTIIRNYYERMVSSDKEQEKKQVTKIKVFLVPSDLGEIKESISISINTPSKPSQEQIINQAFKFHSQGKISEAAKYYQYCIDQGFNDQRVFSNYGVLLKDMGNLQEAELYQRKAMELKPDFADSHYNLGNALKNLQKKQ